MASRVKPQSPQSVAVPTLVPEGRHLGKSSMALSRPVTLVGSRHRAHLHLLSRTVSKTHALIISTEAGVYVRDLASRTHVLVNGKSVLETFLKNGDRLAIGAFTFRFVDSGPNLPRREATPSQCAVEVDGSSLAIAAEGRTLLIGRRSTCDITLTEPSVSICHAVIFELNGKHFIRDLGSRTGTFVNGNSIHQNPLAIGDTIRIGETEMRFVPAGQQTDIDELEDLVGTASLEEGSIPLLPAQRSTPPAPIRVTATQTSLDDLIPLASDDLTHDVAAPEADEIQVTTSAPAEIDLASDPDVAGPNDTLPLPPAHAEAKAEPPVLSARVVDHADSVDLHAEIHRDDSHSQLLVDANLHEERMTGSGTFVEVESEAEEGQEQAGHSVDIAAPADELGLEFHDGVVTSEGPSVDALPHPESAPQPPPAVSSHFDVMEEPPPQKAPATISSAPAETRERESVVPPTAVDEIVSEAALDVSETHLVPIDQIAPISEESSISAPTTEQVALVGETRLTVEEPPALATPPEESAPVNETESIVEEEQHAVAAPLDDYPPATFSEPGAIEEVDLSSSDFRMGSQPAGEVPTDDFEESPAESEDAPAPLLGFAVHPPKAVPAVTPLLNASALVPVVGAASLAAAADVLEKPASSLSSSPAEHDPVSDKDDAPEDAEAIEPSEQEGPPEQIEEPISYLTESDEAGFDESTVVIEATEPTPESAQELESAYPEGAPLTEDESVAIVTSDGPLTDSTFGRDVQEFSGSGLGPLVEPLPASPPPEPSGSIQLEQSDRESPASELPRIADGLTEPMQTHLIATEPAPNVEPEFSFDDMAEQVLASEESLEEPMEFGEEIGFVTEESPPISATPFDQHMEPTLDLTTPASDPLSLVAGTDSALVGGDDLIDLEESADAPLTLDEPEPSLSQSPKAPKANEVALPPPLDLFMGMSRDSASFLGGVPIALPPRVLPFAGGVEESLTLSSSDDAVRVAEPHYPMPEPTSLEQEAPTEALISEPLETLTTEESIDFPEDGEETIGSFLNRLEASEPPAELFESTPDALDALPDSMGTLSEITDVLGDHAGPATISPLEKWDTGMPQLIDEAPGPLQWEPASEAGRSPDVAEFPAGAAPESRATEIPEEALEAPPIAPAHPPHPRVPPPPRATRMRALSRPLNSERSVTGGDPDSITIPPFEGYRPATEGQVTTAFDGLAMPPVREVDVFSQNLNPGLGAAFGAASPPAGSFGAATGAATAAGLVGLAAVGVDALSRPPEQVVPSRARRTGTGVAGSRVLHPPKPSAAEHAFAGEAVAPVLHRPTIAPQFAPPTPPRPSRRRRLPLGWILPLMIVLAGASAAGIWYGVRSEGTAQASLRFENLDGLTEAQRHDFEKHQRDLLLKPDFRIAARQIFENNLGGHGGTGLLYSGLAEEKAYSALVDGAAIAPHSQHLLIHYRSTDPQSDRLRLQALLKELFIENHSLIDAAARLKSDWNTNDREAQKIHDRMDELTRSLADEQKAVVDAAPLQAQLDQLKGENAKLWKTWTDAAALMRDTQATIDHLELAGPAAPATTANGETLKPDDDPQVKEFATRLKQIDTSLASARSAHNASADRANKSLDLALSDFQQKIMAAKANLKDGSELSSYLVAAQQAQDTIRQLNADLVERQKSEQQRLAELRRVLSEKQEARLKSVWAADPELKRMQDDLAVKEHRYNAATGSGLNDEAKQLQAEIDDLKKQIDARRDLIGTGDIYADEVKDLQTFIDDNLKAMDAERARNDQRMQEQLKALASAAPQIEKLPADQKAQAEEFEKRLADLNDARKQYAAAMATATPDSDEQVKKLETETTEMQAKLDARRKQLADENRKTLTRQQEEARLAALDEAKQKLTASRKGEEDSSLAVRANKENIDDLQAKLDHLKAQGAKTASDVTLVNQLNATLAEKKSQEDAEYQAMQQSPIPLQPTEEDVTVTELKDPRQQYILITLLGFAVTTLVLMVISRPGHEIPVADLAPLEEVEFEQDHASALESRGPESSHSNGNGHSEDHPMAV